MDLNQYCQDAAHRMVGRADDNQGIFVETLLTHTLAELFRFKYPATPFASGELIEIDASADPGADRVGWQMIGEVGKFRTVADNGDDMPRIDLKGSYASNKACTVSGYIEYTEQDLQAASMQRMFSISDEKGKAARMAWDRTLDDYIRVGNFENGENLPGLCNVPGRSDIAATAAWSTLTPSQICDEFSTVYDAIYSGTAGVMMPDTVVMPTRLRSLFKKQNSIAANTSIEGFLKETYPEIDKWVYNAGMNDAGRDGATCLLMYNRQRESMSGLMPEFIRPLQPQAHNLCWRVPFKSRWAGLRVNAPAMVATIYGV